MLETLKSKPETATHFANVSLVSKRLIKIPNHFNVISYKQ